MKSNYFHSQLVLPKEQKLEPFICRAAGQYNQHRAICPPFKGNITFNRSIWLLRGIYDWNKTQPDAKRFTAHCGLVEYDLVGIFWIGTHCYLNLQDRQTKHKTNLTWPREFFSPRHKNLALPWVPAENVQSSKIYCYLSMISHIHTTVGMHSHIQKLGMYIDGNRVQGLSIG